MVGSTHSRWGVLESCYFAPASSRSGYFRDTTATTKKSSPRTQQAGSKPTHLNVASVSRIWASGSLITRISRLRIVERRREGFRHYLLGFHLIGDIPLQYSFSARERGNWRACRPPHSRLASSIWHLHNGANVLLLRLRRRRDRARSTLRATISSE